MSDDEFRREYEGYSDIKTVSNRVGMTIDEAVDACSTIDALHTDRVRVRPPLAAELRRDIMSGALTLVPDLQGARSEEGDDIYGEILERWGVEDDGSLTEDGYLGQLRRTDLQNERPDWIIQLGIDIRKAGWEIGYLRAGRVNKQLDVPDEEREARDMFE